MGNGATLQFSSSIGITLFGGQSDSNHGWTLIPSLSTSSEVRRGFLAAAIFAIVPSHLDSPTTTTIKGSFLERNCVRNLQGRVCVVLSNSEALGSHSVTEGAGEFREERAMG